MSSLKKIVFVFCLCLAVVSCKSDDKDIYEFNVGTSQGENSIIYMGLAEMKKNVEERTGGKLKVNIFPSSQLGPEEDIIEQAKLGANVGTITDSGRLSEYVKELGIVGMAYVANNYEDMKKIVESEQYEEWLKMLPKHNLSMLSMNWFQGSRHFFTKKPIKTPDDLKDILVRTPAPPVWTESIRAIGAVPVAMPWTEVYPAMQQKVIDAFEVQTSAAYSSSLQETVKYLTKTSHFQLMSGIVTGHKYLESIPEEYRNILIDEAIKAGNYASELELSKTLEYEKEFVDDYGMIINEVDITLFENASRKAIDALGYREAFDKLVGE